MVSNNTKRGSRLLIPLIDTYASQYPSRVWSCIPISDTDLSKGFKDITYATLANAVNHAVVWLKENLPPAQEPFETVAYLGPKDISYPILTIAVAKCGRKLLLPSPFASVAAQALLLGASECTTYLHTGVTKPNVEKVLEVMSGRKANMLQVPDVAYFLQESQAPKTLFEKSWEEAKSDPWVIFHTSGTTGQPKLITYTHQMMASLDTLDLIPEAVGEGMPQRFENMRWYTPMPSLHSVGMIVSLQFTVFLGSVLVVGPATPGPATPSIAADVLTYGHVEAAMLPPALIDAMVADPPALKTLHNLKTLCFAGAPLLRKTAEKLLPYVSLKPAMGSTEAGAYFLRITGEEDWEWYSFRSCMGMEFRHVTQELYEAVFVKKEGLERWQQVFTVFPEKSEFSTRDLWEKHREREGVWRYVGRMDDVVVLSLGEMVYASSIEEKIMQHPKVSGVLIGGQSRARPWVVVEWKDDGLTEGERLESLRPVIEEANRSVSDLVKLRMELLLIVGGDRKLIRTVKGSVDRRGSEALYKAEIDRMYEMLG